MANSTLQKTISPMSQTAFSVTLCTQSIGKIESKYWQALDGPSYLQEYR